MGSIWYWIMVFVIGVLTMWFGKIKPADLLCAIKWICFLLIKLLKKPYVHIPLIIVVLLFSAYQFWIKDLLHPPKRLVVALTNFHLVSGAELEDNNALISHLQDSLRVYKNDIKLLHSIYPAVRDSIEARKLGEKEKAHIVIWGSIEKTQKEAEIKPRITIVKPLGKMKLEARQPEPAMGVSIAELEEIAFRKRKAREITDVILFIYGLAKYWGKNYETARAILENIQNKTPETFFYIGNCYSFLPEPDYFKAADGYEMAIQLGSTCALTYSNLGGALMKTDRCEEAVKKFEQGVGLDSSRAELWVNWGATLGKLGRYPEAIEKLQHGDRLMPNSVEILVNLASALALSGRYSEAEGKFEQATHIDPQYAEGYSNWGATLFMAGRYNDAIKKFKKAVEINPLYADAWYNWGLVLMDSADYQEAIKKFEKTIQINPDYVDAYFKTGIAYGKLDSNWKAAEQFQRAALINPNDAETWYSWGVALDNQARQARDLGKHEEAREKYEEAIDKYDETVRLDSNYVSAYLNWGADLNDLGRFKESIKTYFKLLSVSPNSAKGFAGLGTALMNSSQQVQARWALSMAAELFKKQGRDEDVKKIDELLKKLEEK